MCDRTVPTTQSSKWFSKGDSRLEPLSFVTFSRNYDSAANASQLVFVAIAFAIQIAPIASFRILPLSKGNCAAHCGKSLWKPKENIRVAIGGEHYLARVAIGSLPPNFPSGS